MSGKSSSKRSRQKGKVRESKRGFVDWEFMRNQTEEDIMRTSPPELANLPPDFFKDAVVVYPERLKIPISLRVDPDILEWFKAEGPLYQTRMNAVLRRYMDDIRKQRKAEKPIRKKAR